MSMDIYEPGHEGAIPKVCDDSVLSAELIDLITANQPHDPVTSDDYPFSLRVSIWAHGNHLTAKKDPLGRCLSLNHRYVSTAEVQKANAKADTTALSAGQLRKKLFPIF
jgi:hypothetical protein